MRASPTYSGTGTVDGMETIFHKQKRMDGRPEAYFRFQLAAKTINPPNSGRFRSKAILLQNMRLNYETCLVGRKCVLVPYRPEHVPKYHEWMKDPNLLEATGSEPLSLEEEIEMQQTWRDDSDKCTFIVLARDGIVSFDLLKEDGDYPDFCQKNLQAMTGDVNMFFSEEEDENDNDDETIGTNPQQHVQRLGNKQQQAEIDIMIAEKNYQGMGLGKEASCLMMLYGAKSLGIRRFFCKINETNEGSLGLFKRMGFEQCGYAKCFAQFELELKRETSKEVIAHLESICGHNEWLRFQCSIATEERENISSAT